MKGLASEDLKKSFPDLTDKELRDAQAILSGSAVGKNLSHVWFDQETGKAVTYNGRVEAVFWEKQGMYEVSYSEENETYEDDAVDYKMSKIQLATDVICGDLVLV